VRITVGAPAADIHLTNHPDDFEGVCPPRLLWEREIDLRGEAYSLSTALAADDTRLVIRAYQPGYALRNGSTVLHPRRMSSSGFPRCSASRCSQVCCTAGTR
jgi:hypothetical protein